MGSIPYPVKPKTMQLVVCSFSTKYTALRRKIKDWLARNQDNMSKFGDMSICRLLFQWASTINIQLSVLVQYKMDVIIISLKINLYLTWYRWKIAQLVLNNNHSTHLLFNLQEKDLELTYYFKIFRQPYTCLRLPLDIWSSVPATTEFCNNLPSKDFL